MKLNNIEARFSPRKKENWEPFKEWAALHNFWPEEITGTGSFKEALDLLKNRKTTDENAKEYYINLYELLLAVEKLYINMRKVDATLVSK